MDRGRRPTSSATRSHNPLPLPVFGLAGQNAARPSRTSTAGRKVSEASSEAAMPIAATGPRPLLELRSLNSRHSMPSTTVPAEAQIGSSEARQARRMARRGSALRSSSR